MPGVQAITSAFLRLQICGEMYNCRSQHCHWHTACLGVPPSTVSCCRTQLRAGIPAIDRQSKWSQADLIRRCRTRLCPKTAVQWFWSWRPILQTKLNHPRHLISLCALWVAGQQSASGHEHEDCPVLCKATKTCKSLTVERRRIT